MNNQISSQEGQLSELYLDVIREHNRHPHFKKVPQNCRLCQEGYNPSCGDRLTLYITLNDENHLSVFFDGHGCAISQASSSILCSMLQNVSCQTAREVFERAESIYTGRHTVQSEDLEDEIEALSGVAKFPVRIKCAALPWKTLEILLQEHFDGEGKPLNLHCPLEESCPTRQEQKTAQKRHLKVISTEESYRA
jgi:nitrogen fixation NifU-like protein